MVAPNKKKRSEVLVEQIRKEAADTCIAILQRAEESHKQEAIELHNRLAAIIEEMKPAPENVLLVFALLKHEVIDHVISKMAEAQEPPQPGETPPASEA